MNKPGALFLFAQLFFQNLAWLLQPRGLGVMINQGRVTVGVGYTVIEGGLRRLPMAMAATLTLTDPLTIGMLGCWRWAST